MSITPSFHPLSLSFSFTILFRFCQKPPNVLAGSTEENIEMMLSFYSKEDGRLLMPLFAVTHLKLKKKSSPKASYPSAEDKRGVMVASHGSFVFPYFYRQLKFSGRLYFSRKAFYYYLSQTWKLSMFSLKGKKKRRRQRDGLFLYLGAPEKKRETWTVVSSLEYLTPVHHQPLSFFFLKLYFVSLGLCFFFF